MSSVLPTSSLTETTLWKTLNTAFQATPHAEVAQTFALNLKEACKLASDRIKAFPYYHPQYTLHDETHLLRVTELMALVLGSALHSLNPIEIALLIAAAYFHDQGMVPDPDEWAQTKLSLGFKLSLERWEIDHPNLKEIRAQLHDSRLSTQEHEALRQKEQELLDAHRTAFLRQTHGERSEAIVNRLFGNSHLLQVVGTNLAPFLGRLCASHVWSADRLTDETGFRVDEAVGTYQVNLRYLALVLRLADILDLDGDRTPDVLFRTIHFSSPISIAEWAKHRSVQGWEIGLKRIRFTMQCEHPAYQRAAYEFMDAIDGELGDARRIVQGFPREVPAHYELGLPPRVDRDRIEPKNGAYRYSDLEFNLSRDEVVKLLMMDELYEDRSLFVRELLQNALDALRYRTAIHGKGKPDWDGGRVTLEHALDEYGYQVVRCTDNGIGMDEAIIKNFLTKVGRSYYRSPEFEQQRIEFRANSVDFDPCAQFGIGFMSCFMFGDRITVRTRRDYGPGRAYGEPLAVEINGLGGLLVIRDGDPGQPPGTTVEIVGPKKPAFLDEWSDPVKLTRIVRSYALAAEFPIVTRTLIDELREEIEVKPTSAVHRTFLERTGVSQCVVIEEEFSETDPNIHGKIRAAFVQDSSGTLALFNEETRWSLRKKAQGTSTTLTVGETRHEFHLLAEESATCIDGILVCGTPPDTDRTLPMWGNAVHLGDPFIMDIRGTLKPRLTPARRPPQRSLGFRSDSSWTKVQRLADRAHAKLWEKVVGYLDRGMTHETFWALTLLHEVPIHRLNPQLVWAKLAVPTLYAGGMCEWVRVAELGHIFASEEGQPPRRETYLTTRDGRRIGFPKDFAGWYPSGRGGPNWRLKPLLLGLCHVVLVDGKPTLLLDASANPARPDEEIGMADPETYLFCLPFSDQVSSLLAAENPLDLANASHPVVAYVRLFAELAYDDLDDLQHYCRSLLWVLSNHDNLRQISRRDVKGGRHYRRLGCLYRSFEWNRYDPALKPPYEIWGQASGVVEVTHDDLMRWSEIPSEQTLD